LGQEGVFHGPLGETYKKKKNWGSGGSEQKKKTGVPGSSAIVKARPGAIPGGRAGVGGFSGPFGRGKGQRPGEGDFSGGGRGGGARVPTPGFLARGGKKGPFRVSAELTGAVQRRSGAGTTFLPRASGDGIFRIFGRTAQASGAILDLHGGNSSGGGRGGGPGGPGPRPGFLRLAGPPGERLLEKKKNGGGRGGAGGGGRIWGAPRARGGGARGGGLAWGTGLGAPGFGGIFAVRGRVSGVGLQPLGRPICLGDGKRGTGGDGGG